MDVHKTLNHKTETRLRRYIFPNSQDRDDTRRSTFKTETKPRRPKNVSRSQCRSSKTLTGEVCHLTTCFLRVRSIIFFVIIRKPDTLHECSQNLKSRDPRPKTENLGPISSRPRWDRDVEPSRPRRDVPKTSRDRLETETSKTETTALVLSGVQFLHAIYDYCCRLD